MKTKLTLLTLILSMLILFMVFCAYNSNAFYRPEEIEEDFIENWMEEAKELTNHVNIPINKTGHALYNWVENDRFIIGLGFKTVARRIIEHTHESYRRGKDVSISDLKDEAYDDYFTVQSIIGYANREGRIISLVFKVRKYDEIGKRVKDRTVKPQDISDSEKVEIPGRRDQYFIIQNQKFKYEDFPTKKEYKNDRYKIIAQFRGRATYLTDEINYEFEIPWGEID